MLIIVSFGLFVSGVTVWPAVSELRIALGILESIGLGGSDLHNFVEQIRNSLIAINQEHPQIMYGYDWLAFAHICLAILFFGAVKDPVRNRWIIECGLIMCALIPVLGAICIPYRQIPFYWFWVDFAFAPAAALPLIIALRDVRRLERESAWNQKTPT